MPKYEGGSGAEAIGAVARKVLVAAVGVFDTGARETIFYQAYQIGTAQTHIWESVASMICVRRDVPGRVGEGGWCAWVLISRDHGVTTILRALAAAIRIQPAPNLAQPQEGWLGRMGCGDHVTRHVILGQRVTARLTA